MRSLCLNFDGSAVRNPGGPGGWGWRLADPAGRLVACDLGRLPADPRVTNNTAEYEGLIRGLRFLAARRDLFDAVTVRGDSKMVVMQAAGKWRVKAEGLRPLWAEVAALIGQIGRQRLRFEWVPREQNAECDELSKGNGRAFHPPSPAVVPPVPSESCRPNPTRPHATRRTDFVRAVDCRP